MDRSYQNIQNELLNLEPIQTKIRHNKEIADQQFQLLNQEIEKTNQDFESLLDQNKKSTDETVGTLLTELTDLNSNVEIIVEKTKQVDLLTQEVNRKGSTIFSANRRLRLILIFGKSIVRLLATFGSCFSSRYFAGFDTHNFRGIFLRRFSKF